ncbi:MFS transporter [Actinomadura xylanilytica]|uniref:MFS transporter n=1 Tax=Actinomadura xylanilytica TaxID=887459 RepID=UPI00255A786E|nr:MFS transporter [Actinomadura xylanilytica]MDL4776953.1 MFS transporter [Actinomadura xylanilytica]
MPSPTRAPSYAAVLLTPHVRRVFTAALLGRLSYGTVFLSLILALAHATGSYTQAGTALALNGAASSLLSPLRAKLIDRHGPHRTLPPMAVAYSGLLAAISALTWHPGAPAALLSALACAAGACAPPLGPVMRTLWSDLLPDRPLLQRAYSLDTVAEELLFVTGPLLAGLAAALTTPALGVAASAALVLAGTLALTTSPFVRDRDRTRAAPAERAGTRIAATLWRPIAVAAGLGACLSAFTLLLVVFTARHHQPAAVAWIEAALAAGSAAGGLAHGTITWRLPAQMRLPLLAAGPGLITATASLAPSVPWLALAAGAAGVFVAPVLTTAYLLTDELTAPHDRTRAGAWVNAAFNAGSAAGTAAAGPLADTVPLPLCFPLATVPLLTVAAVTALRRTTR